MEELQDVIDTLKAHGIDTELHEQGVNTITLTHKELPRVVITDLIGCGIKSIGVNTSSQIVITV